MPGLEFTVASVVAHAAEVPLWYSVDMWSGRESPAAFEVKVLAHASNSSLLTSLLAASRGLAAGVDAAPPETAGFPSLRFAGPFGVRGDGVRRVARAR